MRPFRQNVISKVTFAIGKELVERGLDARRGYGRFFIEPRGRQHMEKYVITCRVWIGMRPVEMNVGGVRPTKAIWGGIIGTFRIRFHPRHTRTRIASLGIRPPLAGPEVSERIYLV